MNNPWEQIKTPLSHYNVRRIEHSHPYDFFWARDISGDYLLIYKCNLNNIVTAKLPELSGIEIVILDSGIDDKVSLVLKLKNRADWDIFNSLCRDIVNATQNCPNEDTVMTVILRRLERWRLFLKKDRPQILSEAEQKGLLGELLFLKDYLFPKYPVHDSLAFWQGPLDAPQDFSVGNTAVEVKCQLGTSRPLIKISSVDQLNSQSQQLFLFVVTLGKGSIDFEGFINLPIIIQKIRNMIEESSPASLEMFDDLLMQAGYLDLPEYSEFFFVIGGYNAYEVRDDFPRLKSKDIPEGILNTKYDINLDVCSPFRVALIRLENLGVDNGNS